MSELRQAFTKVDLVGVLKDMELTVELTNRKGSKEPAIRGHLVIGTGGNTAHTVKVFIYERTVKGETNPAFTSLKTCMDEFQSETALAGRGEDKSLADIVEIKGTSLKVNEYFNQNKMLVSRPEINCSFVSRVKDRDSAVMRAEFTAEVVMSHMKPEINKQGDETGRYIFAAYLPMYEGAIAPINFIVDDEEVADYISNNYENGGSCKIWGEIINRVVVEKSEVKGFGKSKEEVNTTYVNELILTGGEENQYDPDSELAWSKDIIKKALANREIKLEEMKNKPKEENRGTSTGGNKAGFGGKSSGTKPKASDSEDIPF